MMTLAFQRRCNDFLLIFKSNVELKQLKSIQQSGDIKLNPVSNSKCLHRWSLVGTHWGIIEDYFF